MKTASSELIPVKSEITLMFFNDFSVSLVVEITFSNASTDTKSELPTHILGKPSVNTIKYLLLSSVENVFLASFRPASKSV